MERGWVIPKGLKVYSTAVNCKDSQGVPDLLRTTGIRRSKQCTTTGSNTKRWMHTRAYGAAAITWHPLSSEHGISAACVGPKN